MNITLQTNNFNPQNYKYNNNNKQYKTGIAYNRQTTFTGAPDVPIKSGFFKPFTKAFDGFTDWLSGKYLNMYTSGAANFLAKRAEAVDSVVGHMQVLGSTIISGMYMIQTLRNNDLDDDRKKTLAINQGLTWAIATIGSYVLNSKLDNWWEGLTLKYASKQPGYENIAEEIKRINDEKMAEAQEAAKLATEEAKKAGKPLPKLEKPKRINTLKYIEKYHENTQLQAKIKGMGVLKGLLIFGAIYRFVSPVAVTPLASFIGDKFISNKKQG